MLVCGLGKAAQRLLQALSGRERVRFDDGLITHPLPARGAASGVGESNILICGEADRPANSATARHGDTVKRYAIDGDGDGVCSRSDVNRSIHSRLIDLWTVTTVRKRRLRHGTHGVVSHVVPNREVRDGSDVVHNAAEQVASDVVAF